MIRRISMNCICQMSYVVILWFIHHDDFLLKKKILFIKKNKSSSVQECVVGSDFWIEKENRHTWRSTNDCKENHSMVDFSFVCYVLPPYRHALYTLIVILSIVVVHT